MTADIAVFLVLCIWIFSIYFCLRAVERRLTDVARTLETLSTDIVRLQHSIRFIESALPPSSLKR